MKKQIYFLVSLFALIGFSMNVMGASDATQYPGETHKFKVTSHTGASYVWKLYTSSALSSEISSYTDVATLVTANTNEVSITWQKNASGDYYVGVTETIGTCSTQRYTLINVVAAAYDLAVVNKDAADADVALSSCMTGAGRIFSKSETITAMTNEVYFKVNLNNGASPYTNGDWVFDYAITIKDKTANDKSGSLSPVVSIVAPSSGAPTINALTGTAVSVSKLSTFVVKVVFNDNPGVIAADGIDVVFTASNLKVGPGQILETTTGTPASNTITYTRNTYPNTSEITIN